MSFGFYDADQFGMERTMWTVLSMRRASLREQMRSLDEEMARVVEFLEEFDSQWLAAASRRLASRPEARSGDPRVWDDADDAENRRRVFNQAVSLRCSEEELALFDARSRSLADRSRRATVRDADGRTDPRDIIARIKSKAAGNG